MAATIRDVASRAGVSPSTVSRALSRPEMVNDTTLRRVRSAVHELGYGPGATTAGAGTRRRLAVGFLVPDLVNPLFAGLVKGAQGRAREAGFSLHIADTDRDAGAEVDAVRSLADQWDGLVVCSPQVPVARLGTVARDTPMVVVHRRDQHVPSVSFDNAGGIEQVVLHLAALGHRRVAWLAGPAGSVANMERQSAMVRACDDQGIEWVEVGSAAPTFEGGVAAGDVALASGATAVAAYNDVVALGLLSRLRARGAGVPDHLSVVGFDDIPAARMAQPSLTSVALPKEQAGKAAVDLLLEVLEGDRDVPSVELPTALVVRESSGLAPRP